MMIKLNNKCYGVKLLQADLTDHNKIFTLIGFYNLKDLKEVANYIIDTHNEFKKITLKQLYKDIQLKIGHYNTREQINFVKSLVIDIKDDDKCNIE